MIVYLIGFMGCGKSTLGKRVAAQLGYQFIDLDTYIEQKYMTTIHQLFEKQGEAYFREIESKSLHEINGYELVIATGGGTPCFHNNMEWMNKNGTTIYLELSNEALFSRLVGAKYKRPSVKNLDETQLKEFISTKMAERIIIYQQAQHTFNAFDVEILPKITNLVLR